MSIAVFVQVNSFKPMTEKTKQTDSRKYEDETLQKMVMMGVFGYDSEKIINIVEPKDPKEFQKDLNNPQSILNKYYKKGMDQAEFEIDKALWKKARQGDHKAIQKLEERKDYEF